MWGANFLTPKVALFFVVFLPQFVNLEQSTYSDYKVGLALLFAVLTILFLLILGLFAGKIGVWLQEKKSIATNVNTVAGSVLVLLGLLLFASHQN